MAELSGQYYSASANAGFIDLATFGELEAYIYAGANAITHFVASIQKSNWFTVIPLKLRCSGGGPGFNAKRVPFNATRQADYVLGASLRGRIPTIGFDATVTNINATVRWCRNLMHNLVEHVQLEFNDLNVEEFDHYWMDIDMQYRLPAGMADTYNNSIGNIPSFVSPAGPGEFRGGQGARSVPLNFFFSEDSGFALPVAALPFNEVKITFDFRDWKNLILIDSGGDATITVNKIVVYKNGVPTTEKPTLTGVEVIATYAIVHNDERIKMGEGPRDILGSQIQSIQTAPFKDPSTRSSFDIRLSHSVMAIFYMAQNISLQHNFSGDLGADQSNYSTLSSVLIARQGDAVDPLYHSALIYENQPRFTDTSVYSSVEAPYRTSINIPNEIGYHVLPYALNLWDATCASGSTGYGKLANVAINHQMGQAAILASQGKYPNGDDIFWPGVEDLFPQVFQHVLLARNHQIFRAANGSLGIPTQ